MKVTLRKLKELCAHLKKEERILVDRVVPTTLMALHKKGLCSFYVKKGKIVGFGVLWPTLDLGWYELGTLWVHPELRGLGISGSIFAKLIKKIPEKTSVFLITKSRKVAHEAIKHGWVEDSDWLESKFWEKPCRPVGSNSRSARRFSIDARLFYSLPPHH